MNAETGSEPESPKKRGRIPQSAWPQILERYRSGATLSAIAREFECTPSAISYIIKKAEAASGQGDAAHGDDDQGDAQADAGQPSAPAAPAEEAAAPATAAPAAEPAPAAPAEAEAPAEPRRAGRTVRGTLTRAPRTEPAADQTPVEAPAASPAPAAAAAPAAPTETLRLNRQEPAPAPAPAPAAPVAAAPATTDAPRTAGQPTPPVDAIEGRLRDTAKACISAYRGWRQQPGEATIQSLSESVHELRKALARVEIDMSASRREEQAIRPIPIPAHRASRRPN